MKFVFSAAVGRGRENQVVFSEEVDLPDDTDMNQAGAAWKKWNDGLIRSAGVCPVYKPKE